MKMNATHCPNLCATLWRAVRARHKQAQQARPGLLRCLRESAQGELIEGHGGCAGVGVGEGRAREGGGGWCLVAGGCVIVIVICQGGLGLVWLLCGVWSLIDAWLLAFRFWVFLALCAPGEGWSDGAESFRCWLLVARYRPWNLRSSRVYEILKKNTDVSQIIEIGQHESKRFPNS